MINPSQPYLPGICDDCQKQQWKVCPKLRVVESKQLTKQNLIAILKKTLRNR